jgi:hypothetical protein
VTALSAEDISEGPLAGRTALYAEIEPSERMKKLTEEGRKFTPALNCTRSLRLTASVCHGAGDDRYPGEPAPSA